MHDTGICFLDAMMNYLRKRNEASIMDTIKALKQIISDHQYDSDALIQDLEEIQVSNLYNICNYKEHIIHCNAFIQYIKCLYIFIFIP